MVVLLDQSRPLRATACPWPGWREDPELRADKAIVRAQAKDDNGYRKTVREITGEAYASPYHGKMLNHLMKSLVQAGMDVDAAVITFAGDREGGRVGDLRVMLQTVLDAYLSLDADRQEIILSYYGKCSGPATDAERQRVVRAIKQLRWKLNGMLSDRELRYDYDGGEEEIAA